MITEYDRDTKKWIKLSTDSKFEIMLRLNQINWLNELFALSLQYGYKLLTKNSKWNDYKLLLWKAL